MSGDRVRTAERALLTSQGKVKTLEVQLNQALADYSRAKDVMDDLQANNARVKDKLRASKLRYKELVEESETREQEIEELRSLLEDTETERDSLQDAAADSRKEAEITLQRNKQLERKIKGLDEEIADRESRLRDAKLKIRDIEAQGDARVDTNLSLKSKLRDAESMVAQYSKELETKDSTLANNALQIRKMKQEADHWRDEYFKIRDSDSPTKDQDSPLTVLSPGDSSPTVGPCKRCSSLQRPARPNLPVLVDVIPDSEDEPLAAALDTQSPVGSPSIPRYTVARARAPSPLPPIRPVKPLPHSKSRNAKRPREYSSWKSRPLMMSCPWRPLPLVQETAVQNERVGASSAPVA
ncbi:hypothetical protein BS47DRAFT_1357736 [Hydnum rufescens UP504]|uniref:Uncharacterized protein n=1 Tax=Hydnum rufescens UP504 TaxID=1448309 RepID=A0A9P6B935_9AGAM|nr:hypothetical protein BS47DRAFT_1357736 [Hydnum rufescens UP504]